MALNQAQAGLSHDEAVIWRDYLQHPTRTMKLIECGTALDPTGVLPSLLRAFAATDDKMTITDMGTIFCVFLHCQFASPNAPTWETYNQGTDLWVLGIARRVEAPVAELIFATCAQRFKRDDGVALPGEGGEESDGRFVIFENLCLRYDLRAWSLGRSPIGSNSLQAPRSENEMREIEYLSQVMLHLNGLSA
ncbi:hypothetical protein F5Y19DRAFT_246458 [Xylariaceae sp. FL1651]|nr:hypothetical protein F5Y19DRAFT_246458 [Xylariaceae sp. FL1651]